MPLPNGDKGDIQRFSRRLTVEFLKKAGRGILSTSLCVSKQACIIGILEKKDLSSLKFDKAGLIHGWSRGTYRVHQAPRIRRRIRSSFS